MADNFISAKHKLVDFGFKSGTFKGDDGRDVDYTQTILRANIDGDIEEFVLSGQNPIKPKLLKTLLKGAKDDGGTILDGDK